MKRLYALPLLALLWLAMTQQALATDPKPVARHGKWGSYAIDERGNKVCYMAAKPDKQEGAKGKTRGDVYALITSRPAENIRNEFSYVSGYVYKTGSDATLSIDGKIFTLFTKDDSAWAKNASADSEIAEAMGKGARMTIRGISSHGTKTLDTFSLKGAGAALKDIGRLCGP